LFRNCLNQHRRRRRGAQQNFLESELHLAIPSERVGFTRLPQGHGRGKFRNTTTIIFLLIRLRFMTLTTRLSQHQIASERSYDRFFFPFFQQISIWRLGFGLQENRGYQNLITTVWRARVPGIPLGYIANSHVLSILLPKNWLHVRLVDPGSNHIITH
jgi:hypothetical protein